MKIAKNNFIAIQMLICQYKIVAFAIGLACLVISNIAFAQNSVPFTKGVNLTNWFQASSAKEIQFTKFTRKDLERIKSLGCDVIRLPINLHSMTSGEPDHILDPLFLNFLDQVITWAEELDIHLIIDNHSFDPAVNTSPTVGVILVKVWTQMAEHYKNRSDLIYYEVLNEPHGISDSEWGAIQQSVIDAIRTRDTKHFIVVGPAGWNSYNNLKDLPVYSDPKLIYTFHFYDPFLFTHQGASWTDPSMVPIANVPFPFNAGPMPAVPASLKGTWLESAFNNYSAEGTVSKVKSLIDIALAFKNQRNVPLFCGEFGVYIPNSNNDHRMAWYKLVKDYFAEKSIPWTMWDYTGGFGLFEKGSNELFDYDLNVQLLEALDMNVPTQQAYIKKPLTKGFMIYDDYIGEGIVDASNNANGIRNLYDQAAPKAGNYSIYWTGSDQYGNVAFDFKPDVDLSLLKTHDHVLKFWAKSNSSTARFDIRFIDTKISATDHPWRMGKTIEQVIPGDQSWHLVEVPLKDLVEKGSWDNAWFNPEGKFDWTSVDRFEIVAEHHNLQGISLWFDDIQIFGEEVLVEEPEPVTGIESGVSSLDFNIAPNPVVSSTSIYFSVEKPGDVEISIFSITGEEICKVIRSVPRSGNYNYSWNGINKNNVEVAPGLYLVRLKSGGRQRTKKLVKVTD